MDGYAVASTWVSTIHVLEALLKAKVVVVFATKAYSERRLCRLETRLALADGGFATTRLFDELGWGVTA